MENLFLKAMGVKNTVTENGAITNGSTGRAIVDQFGSAATYRGREYSDVSFEQETLWREDPLMALRFPFYLRMITRKVKINDGYETTNVQNGQGVRDEAFKRLLSLAENHRDAFYYNIWLLPIVGSWKDIWMLMFYDENLCINTIDRNILYALIQKGMGQEEHVDLIKKFMPRIKSSSKVKTDWGRLSNQFAKELAEFLGWSYYQYNKFKSTGKAHEFQKAMCSNDTDNIEWNKIPGRALSQIVHSKYIDNHNLIEAYSNWLSTKEDVNFNGYVYELGQKLNHSNSKAEFLTIDKQFQKVINRDTKNDKITENVWCALDTSGSMTQTVNPSVNVTALDVCKSLGVYFSTLNKGAFHKNVIMFDNHSRIKQLSGSFSEMMSQIYDDAMGGTNFQSVVDEIVRVRRENPNIPLEDYPTTLLVVSDMEFNPVNDRYMCFGERDLRAEQTNYEEMKRKLSEVFPNEFVDKMKFVWWYVTCRNSNFPSRIEDGGCYIMSGFDGSVINLLLGEEAKKTDGKQLSMEELVEKALSQEILLQIKLI